MPDYAVAADYLEERGICPEAVALLRLMSGAMSPDNIANRMREITVRPGDEETDHIAGDALLCEVLQSLGYGDAVGIFEKMSKWYS